MLSAYIHKNEKRARIFPRACNLWEGGGGAFRKDKGRKKEKEHIYTKLKRRGFSLWQVYLDFHFSF